MSLTPGNNHHDLKDLKASYLLLLFLALFKVKAHCQLVIAHINFSAQPQRYHFIPRHHQWTNCVPERLTITSLTRVMLMPSALLEMQLIWVYLSFPCSDIDWIQDVKHNRQAMIHQVTSLALITFVPKWLSEKKPSVHLNLRTQECFFSTVLCTRDLGKSTWVDDSAQWISSNLNLGTSSPKPHLK